jgi:hypothetical protein
MMLGGFVVVLSVAVFNSSVSSRSQSAMHAKLTNSETFGWLAGQKLYDF